MRLHRLRVTAFQAFAGSETVDFDALSESGLFLLHGDTGAGKTTLLDAVTFALYGDVPGARSRDARLRSDHAAPDVRTEVELEVTLRERRLRIVRRPRQERPKLRGEGTTEEPASCTVQELDAASGEWSVLAARRDEADAELGDLLGMSCDQFCQVVLLPQGEFATFLRADSGERQAVLERLFGTDRFARVEQWLADRRKAAWAELREAMQGVREVVARLSQAAGEPPPEAWHERLDELPAWVGGLATHAEASLATAAEARDMAGSGRIAAERALAEGRALAERRERHARAVAELAAWEERQPVRAEAEVLLEAARRAAPLEALLSAAPRQAVVLPAAALAGDPAALRERASAGREQAGALDALVAVEERLTRDERELAALAARADAAAAEAREAGAALAALAQERERLEQTARAARDAAARVERLTAEAEEAARRAERARARDRLAGELTAARAAAATAVDAEQAARQTWLDVRERRLAGMAAELAADLRPGEPCAVCGATEHPAPAHGGAPAADAARVPLAERERAAEAAHADAARARADAERTVAELEAAHAAALAVAGEEPAAALAAHADQTAAARAAAAAEAAAGSAAEQRLAELASDVQARERARAAAAGAEAAARATHAERANALAAERARVEAARGEAASVAERAAALRAEADAAEREAAAREAGFADAAAARAALRDEDARAQLAERISQFDAGMAERRALIADPELQAASAAPAPDLAALEAAAVAAREADAQATRRLGLDEQRHTAVGALAGELEDALRELAPLAEAERLVRELSGLVDGSAAANRLHMRLSAYVLAARLEEVATAATARLERMTNGRYRLVHTDERARRERRAGLELQVVDGWTGEARAPGTLSGGETFLASLALALGLADVVAAEAGGSRLETLFVDEGFGSLDERTLDEVLDVLDALREGGRTVGIVSHVAELRQRIPTRLRVVKGRDGSHVEQRDAATAT